MEVVEDRHRTIRANNAAALARDAWSAHEDIDAVISVLSDALDEFDPYTAEHSNETVMLAVRVAKHIGATTDELTCVARVAALHDVGKIGIPTTLLHHPEALTADQRAVVEEHPVIGERILSDIPQLADVAEAVRHEHERWDGGGYPDGVVGADIPLASRIVLVCDAWHAMISDRPYRAAMDEEDAIQELRAHSGTQFDPIVTDALIEILTGYL